MPPVRAQITTRWAGRGYVASDVRSILSHSVDAAIDTDTDSWNLTVGDMENQLVDMLKRDNEVRVNLFAMGRGQVMSLNMGFADEISFDHNNIWSISGRDLTAVAVDSQHAPQIWRDIRPQVLVAREARKLKIGDKLSLDTAAPFKTYATDGSESYWQVWYRFYRKRKKWLYAEPFGSLVAASLDYGQRVSYHFGSPKGMLGQNRNQWIPVEAVEWRSDKTQRVGEVFIFGHRGDIGFVGQATDPSTREWVKRPTRILSTSDVHNQAEARVEAWEEIFESKVGSVEIKLTIFDPGFLVRQNKMALVNIPNIGLRGEFFIVGVQTIGSLDEGQYQVVRLREKNYAISRRAPHDPVLNAGPGEKVQGSIGAALDGVQYRDSFVEATNTYRGPWPFQLFLSVLLSISQQESPGFRNVRQGGSIEYPGTYDGVKQGQIPNIFQQKQLSEFISNFANEPELGRVRTQWGVGIMQLTTRGYKILADRIHDPERLDDELIGGRWNPDANIKAGAAALASKLQAGVTITSDGQVRPATIAGLSLQPTEENIWGGVAAYNGSGIDALNYAKKVRQIYTDTYKAQVASAIQTARSDADVPIFPGNTSYVLRTQTLGNQSITFTRQSEIDDVKFGRIIDKILVFLLAFVNAGYPVTITALRSDHTHLGPKSAHAWGKAVDLGNYGLSNEVTYQAMQWIARYQIQLGFSQLIGPYPELCIPLGIYDQSTLDDHKTHIHIGWPCDECKKY